MSRKRVGSRYHYKSKRLREKKVIEQDGKCYWCGLPFRDPSHFATLDHLVPWSLGGPLTEENCVVACAPCNQKRGNKI